MTQEEILKGNKLIAEFMIDNINFRVHQPIYGSYLYYQKHVNEYDTWVTLSSSTNKNETPGFYFHSSWNWLMSIVEKIESILDEYHGYFGVHIVSNSCTIQATNFRPDKKIPDPPHYFATYTMNSKIESAWYAIVEFIKWYNTKKQ